MLIDIMSKDPKQKRGDLSHDKKCIVDILQKCGEKKHERKKTARMSMKIDRKVLNLNETMEKFRDHIQVKEDIQVTYFKKIEDQIKEYSDRKL